MQKKLYWKIAYIMLTVVFLSACGNAESSIPVTESKDTGFIVTKAGTYDSADRNAVIRSIDTKEKTITFFNHTIEKNYTLSYDGASKFFDKYGGSLSIEQIAPGEVVDITFLKNKKLINSVSSASEAWEIDNVKDFELSASNHSFRMASGNYAFGDSIYVYAQNRTAELMDINPVDTLVVRGVDREVYSISIDRGHGYLRLKNEDYFIGGWIEIGSKIIKTIGEDMILAVPVGKYDVLISNRGVEGTKEVNIVANKETELDIGDLKTEEIITLGKVVMITTPAEAEVFIDGKQVDISQPIELEYGIHQMIARASGYKTLTQYIKVGQESATLDVTLEKLTEKDETTTPSVSPTPIPTAAVSTQPVTTSNSGYKVYINTPRDVEVYVDGLYVGMSPVSFNKVAGTHEITLRKDGYITRSYTVDITNSAQDENYSFSELVSPEDSDNKNNSDDNSDDDKGDNE